MPRRHGDAGAWLKLGVQIERRRVGLDRIGQAVGVAGDQPGPDPGLLQDRQVARRVVGEGGIHLLLLDRQGDPGLQAVFGAAVRLHPGRHAL